MELRFLPQTTNNISKRFAVSVNSNNTSYLKLNSLNKDTISFRGNCLKKSDFEGMDLYIIEKNKYNIQQFKSKDDLQKLAKQDVAKLITKEYQGRHEETTIQRKAMLKEWFDYVTKENDAYSNTQRLVILSAITKDLKPNNDNIPPILNKGVLADTVLELEERLKNNPKETFDFNKLYQNNPRKDVLDGTDTGETETKWVIIPSKKNDPENFDKNVDKLKLLSHKTWCTKSYNAKPYLSEGDFHVYLEKGQPKLGVRFVGDEVAEVQGEMNNSKIPVKYLDVFLAHKKENKIKLGKGSKKQVENAKKVKNDYEHIKNELGESVKLKTIDDAAQVLNCLGFKVKKENENGLTIDKYKISNELLSFDDFDINEDKLFKFITKIEGDADFEFTKVTNLGNLKSIGGSAIFAYSNITDLGKLEQIGGDAEFYNPATVMAASKIKKADSLKRIGKKMTMHATELNLPNLVSVGNLSARYSKLEAPNLEKIGTFNVKRINELQNIDKENPDAEKLFDIFGIDSQKDDEGYFTISHYETPNAFLPSINMEPIDDSKFLEKVKRIEGDANLKYSKITSLNETEYVGGDLNIEDTNITSLDRIKRVEGNLYALNNNRFQQLGALEYVGKDCKLGCTRVETLGNLKYVGGNLGVASDFLKDVGKLEHVGGYAELAFTKLKNLGNLKYVGKGIDIRDTDINPFSILKVKGILPYYSKEFVVIFKALMRGDELP